METRYPRECCDYDMKVTNVTLRDMMGQNMNVENILKQVPVLVEQQTI